MESYNVDPDTYDHTDISSRPAVLIANYCTQRTPYLTVIHLWDKMSDYLLSSRHDHLYIGKGEVGFSDGDSSSRVTTPSRNNKRSPPPAGLNDIINSVIDLCNEGSGKSKELKTAIDDLAIDKQPLPSLLTLIE